MDDRFQQMRRGGAQQPAAGTGELCSACDAALAEDQRYCLNCGRRRGPPRVDFTAFWRRYAGPAGLIGQAVGSPAARARRAGRVPSRRVSCALAAGVLAVGIAAGAAIGPAAGGGSGEALAGIVPSLIAQVRASAASAGATGGASAPSPTTPTAASESGASAGAVPVHRRKRRHKRARTAEATQSEASAGATPTPAKEGESHAPAKHSPSRGHNALPKPPIDHIWVLTLAQGSFAQALEEPSVYPYLDGELVPEGTLLTHYALVARGELANDIALLSGQAPNAATEANCPAYTAVPAETFSSKTGLAVGPGCVYPAPVQTLPGELSAAGLKWRAYAQGMSPSASAAQRSCVRPASGETITPAPPAAGSDYVLFRDPFIYFDSLLESGACTSNVVDFSQFAPDLKAPSGVPNLSWIIPGACEDAAADPCAPGATGGVAPADSFLKSVVEQITATPEYHSHGLIFITFDGAASTPHGTNEAAAESVVGALLLSPFVHHGARVKSASNDFSLLKSFERLFGVPALGHAADPGLTELGARVYTAAAARVAHATKH